MKFCINLIKSILLIGLSGFSFSCNEEPFPELPAETQTGAGTFGCLVNNELVFAVSVYNQAGLAAGASYEISNTTDCYIYLCCSGNSDERTAGKETILFFFLLSSDYEYYYKRSIPLYA